MKLKLHDFQSNAVRSVLKEFKQADRANVIMPCGTGKSIVGVHVVKRMAPKRLLVVAPSLALVKQLLDTYAEQIGLPRVLVVCSDDSTAKEAREKFEIPGVTTDAGVIAAELRKQSGLIVFSTYQSSPKIAEAFAAGKVPSFDLAVFDEAHHMAGGSKAFTTPLDDSRIKIRKRLFMTATPRVATQSAKDQAEDEGYEFASMDDESRFGREAFYMSFNTAIEGGHLTDYQVAIFVVKESEIESLVNGDEDAKETAKRVALIRAMQEHDIRKVLAYHRSVRQMDWFSEIGLRKTFDAFKESEQVTGSLWSGALDGSDPVSIRRGTLNHFASLNGDSRAVLNNCRVLQEGVDCPSVDAVCLIEPRTQPVDIVQIVGRAIRKSANKKVATIILPVFMPKGVEDDVESFIKSSDFAPVWDVISAIKSHDDRVQGWVSSAGSFSGAASKSHIKFNINLPSGMQGKFYEAIESRIVKRFREPVILTEEMIWEWMQQYFEKNEAWPGVHSMELAPVNTWNNINQAMAKGFHGLPGGSSLWKLRIKMTGETRILTEEAITKWMKEFHERTGKWPSASNNSVTPGGTWNQINFALYSGYRGLPGGSSLRMLRRKITGDNTSFNEVVVSEQIIWGWMKEYFNKNHTWPVFRCKDITPAGTWMQVDRLLRTGRCGLNGGLSLLRLRHKMTGGKKVMTDDAIWELMNQYHVQHGRWPTCRSPEDTPFGSWSRIDSSLSKGANGLTNGLSLRKLREAKTGEVRCVPQVALTEGRIWELMQDYFRENGTWPSGNSKERTELGTWKCIRDALYVGNYGLPGGSSLAKLREKMLAAQPMAAGQRVFSRKSRTAVGSVR